ncbi:hypothetical protein GCM10010228_16190 [Streptomyces massasporeus]|nr:hypothetical protein GCM10010228_16190 [Streptomyces massasporeus]
MPCASVRHGAHTSVRQRPAGPARTENGHLHLPGDLDPQALTDLLGGRYGAPRTLVLDGFTDPTSDESRGAALLVPFGDGAVTIRARAYGDRWIGTGTARDGAGVERPVLVVAHREMPQPPAPARDGDAGAGVDWMERLTRITGWSEPARLRPRPVARRDAVLRRRGRPPAHRTTVRLPRPHRTAPPVHHGPLLRHPLGS